MDVPPSDSGRPLREWISERRKDLRLDQAEAARHAKVGRMAWWEWERGRRTPRDSNFAGIEDALRWKRGSVDAILSGGEPTPLAEPEPLTEEQQQLMDVYHVYVRRYGPDEALRLLKRDVAEINAAREQRARQHRPHAG